MASQSSFVASAAIAVTVGGEVDWSICLMMPSGPPTYRVGVDRGFADAVIESSPARLPGPVTHAIVVAVGGAGAFVPVMRVAHPEVPDCTTA